MTYSGGCLCGKSRYTFEGEPKFSIRCYCRDCQQVSGGGHLPQHGVEKSGFSVTGSVKVHHAVSDSDNALEFGFCGDCGSPLFRNPAIAQSVTFVPAGSLDDPAALSVTKNVFEDRRLPWDES